MRAEADGGAEFQENTIKCWPFLDTTALPSHSSYLLHLLCLYSGGKSGSLAEIKLGVPGVYFPPKYLPTRSTAPGGSSRWSRTRGCLLFLPSRTERAKFPGVASHVLSTWRTFNAPPLEKHLSCHSHKDIPIDRDTLNTVSAILALDSPNARSVLHSCKGRTKGSEGGRERSRGQVTADWFHL